MRPAAGRSASCTRRAGRHSSPARETKGANPRGASQAIRGASAAVPTTFTHTHRSTHPCPSGGQVRFDLVVNGGGPLVLRFLKDGYLEAQRHVEVPINDYVVVDSLALIGQSSKSYVINTDSLRVVVGRFETDLNGDRKLTMLFAPGTICSVTTAAGTVTKAAFTSLPPSSIARRLVT